MSERRRTVIELGTGKTRPALTSRPQLSSARSPWKDILLEHHHPGDALELIDMAPTDHAVVVQAGPPKAIEWKERGSFRKMAFRQGEIHLLPAMVPFSLRSSHSGGIVALSIEPRFFRCAAHDLFAGAGPVELRATAPVAEPFVQAIVTALKTEAESGYAGGRAYGESLATTLSVHLALRFSEARPLQLAESGRLAGHQLRRAIDLIHDRASEDLSLLEMATAVGLSPFHFARLFKRSTGLAPHQYLIQTRVEHARKLLLSSSETTAEIALQVRFCDQSHFTIHFRNVYGTTPRRFRQLMAPRRAKTSP